MDGARCRTLLTHSHRGPAGALQSPSAVLADVCPDPGKPVLAGQRRFFGRDARADEKEKRRATRGNAEKAREQRPGPHGPQRPVKSGGLELVF